jgi:hypothetical protein
MFNLITSTLAAQRDTLSLDFPLAARWQRDTDGLPRLEMRVYNGTGGTLTKNNWYEITFDGDEETNPKLVAIASGATSGVATGAVKYVGVATEAAVTTAFTWVVVFGYYSPFVEGTTNVAKDDYLKFDTSVSLVAPIKDAAARTTSSVAIACEAQTADNATTAAKCFLLGEKVLIAV